MGINGCSIFLAAVCAWPVFATSIDCFGICEECILTLSFCRKMSFDDKRRLGTALTQLSPEDLSKALDIVAQDNPEFQATAQEVDLDIDTQVIIILPCLAMS